MSDNGNGAKQLERQWLVWGFRILVVALAGWTLLTTQQLAVSVEGIRVLVVTQGRDLDRLQDWRETFGARQ